jgi:methylated-DNA-[protein]-cysteine S-methyltransferase
MNFSDSIYSLCRKIPKGRVSTYKELGRALKTKAYRAIGQVLKRNTDAPHTPCHRIVASNGSIGGFMGKTSGKMIGKKIKLLEKEGIKIKNKKIVDFEVYKLK